MPIKTDFIDFEREKAEDCATTQNQTKGAVPEVAQTESERVGLPQYWRLAKDPREVRAIFRFILADRRVRVERPRLLLVRPPSSGSAQRDGAEAREEFFEGHDEIERSDQIRSPAQPADESPKWMEPNEQTDDPAEFLAEVSRARYRFSEPTRQTTQHPDAPGSAPSSPEQSLSGQSGDTVGPTSLLDRRVSQRDWEREYGVPYCLIGAADVLYYHRKRVASAEVAEIDAAILRLYGPWIRRHAASSPIPQDCH